MRRNTTLASLVIVAIQVPAFAAGWSYHVSGVTVTDLGVLPNDTTAVAEDINDRGDIVGQSYGGGLSRPFAYWNNQMFAIGMGPFGLDGAGASGINDSREVVGWWIAATGLPAEAGAFHWHPGMPSLEMLQTDAAPGLGYAWDAYASDINDAGVIVGSVDRYPGGPPPPNTPNLCYDNLPVRWLAPLSSTLPDPLFCIADPNQNETWEEQGLRPVAYGINNAGSIVGTDGGSTTFSMFIFKNGQRIAVPAPAGVPQVDSLGNELDGYARSISDNDVVAGTYGYEHDGTGGGPGSYRRAFFWDGIASTSVNLGVLPGGTWSHGNDVNAQRMVVGAGDKIYLGSFLRETAFIWHKHFGLYALPGFGGVLPGHCQAKALNNRKSTNLVQVVGYCFVNGQQHAVRWDVTVVQLLNFPL
jgi:uncharacterized membrane protein